MEAALKAANSDTQLPPSAAVMVSISLVFVLSLGPHPFGITRISGYDYLTDVTFYTFILMRKARARQGAKYYLPWVMMIVWDCLSVRTTT